MTMSDVPPTEPVAVTARKPRKPAAPRAKIDGAKFLPDLERHRASLDQSHWYWIGTLPGTPVEWATIGGECFPKMEELIIRDGEGGSRRVPVIGALVKLDKRKIDNIVEALSRSVVRFTDGGIEKPAGSSNATVADVMAEASSKSRRKGFLITIPTAKEAKERAENNLPPPAPYSQQKGDEPLARYVFAQLCDDQAHPSRGEFYPEPLETTGLEWPGND